MATIVGVAGFTIDDGALYLRVRLSDGSVGACWWLLDELVRHVAVVAAPSHAPTDTRLQ
jgi:hypothetical protein